MDLEDKPSSEVESALAALNRLFAGELWKAKSGSAYNAFSRLERCRNYKRKLEIVNETFRDWKEESAAAIREYFPQYNPIAGSVAATIGIFSNKKGQVFTAGAVNWTLGLSQDGGWTAIDQITLNVFEHFR